jgi:hypothetical protein
MRGAWLGARVSVAIVAAAAAPALILGGLARSLDGALLVFAIALPHALLLGLPLFMLAYVKRRINAITSILGGFLVGAVPSAILSMLGVGTWPSNVVAPVMFGACGATGGLAFFLLWILLGTAFERSGAEKRV